MKNIFTSLALSAVSLVCMAQSSSVVSNSTTTFQPFEINRIISNLPDVNLIGTESSRGKDELDSTFYLNTQLYEFPYNSWPERLRIDTLTAAIVQAYNADLPHHTGGYCSSNRLSKKNIITSKKLQMYYGEDGNPLIVGGYGRNYALLRLNDKNNPNYRHIKGLEWWLEYKGKKSYAVRIKTFNLHGPLSAHHYKNALMQSRCVNLGNDADSQLQQIIRNANKNNSTLDLTKINWESVLAQQSNEQLLLGLSMIVEIYREHPEMTKKTAIISSINDRIKAILVNKPTQEEKSKLFNTINGLDGYYAQVIFSDGKKITKSFSWLQNVMPRLKIFATTWVERGDATCSISKPNDKGGHHVVPANFIYQVTVEDHYNKDFE